MNMKKASVLIIPLLLLLTAVSPISYSLNQPTWNGPVRLTNHLGSDIISLYGGSLALDQNNKIHAVVYYNGWLYHIYDNQGFINETAVVQITAGSSGLRAEYIATAAIGIDSNDVIHIVYASWDGSDLELYYVHSTQSNVFSSPVKITENDLSDAFPKMVIDKNDTLHIVYQTSAGSYQEGQQQGALQTDLKYIYSTGVESFSDPVSVVKPSWSPTTSSQSFTVDENGTVHIAYFASEGNILGKSSIIYTNNSDGVFDTYDMINITDYDLSPSIICDSYGNIHMVFRGYRETTTDTLLYDIYYVNNSVGSFNTSNPMKISNITSAWAPKIALSSSNTVNIIFNGWNGTASEENIKLYYTSNSTGSFGSNYLLPVMEFDQFNPSIAIDDTGALHVIFVSGEQGDEDIYYLTTSSYTPVGVGPPPDPTWIFIVIGAVGGGAAIIVFVILFRKFRALEKEVWKPNLEAES